LTKNKIKGTDKLLKSFKDMKNVDEKQVKKLTLQGAGLILASAKSFCKNNTVREALGYITKNDARFPRITLIGVRSGYGTATFTAPALAVIEEYGTAERFKNNGSSTGYVNPRPFMRPAIDQNKDKVKAVLIDGMIKIVEQQANKNNLK
jgi:HK97 gp10 family phage protein